EDLYPGADDVAEEGPVDHLLDALVLHAESAEISARQQAPGEEAGEHDEADPTPGWEEETRNSSDVVEGSAGQRPSRTGECTPVVFFTQVLFPSNDFR